MRARADTHSVGERITVGLQPHRHQVTAYTRNRGCRFDHERWTVELLDTDPAGFSIGACLAAYGADGGDAGGIRVAGEAFARRLVCPECGFQLGVLQILSRLGIESCPSCSTPMLAPGVDTIDVLRRSAISDREADMTLQQLGLRSHDVFSVFTEEGERHLMLGDPHLEEEYR